MSITKWELKQNFKSFLVWSLFLVGIQFMYFSAFQSFAGEEGLFAAKLQVLPKVFLKIFGIEKIDFTDILHFFAMQGQIFVFLVASFFGGRLASSILSKEEYEKTSEFILTRPVSRKKYIFEKFLVVLTYQLLFDLVLTFSNYFYFNKYKVKPLDTQLMWQLFGAFWGVHLFITAVGFIISVVNRKRTLADTQIMFFIFGFYILNLVGRITESFKFLNNFTPFGLFDPAEIVKTGKFNTLAFILTITLFFGSLFFGLIYYEKKDIYA